MSFILDALRKSEAERQRQDGPALLEMRPSRPQRRLPIWAIGFGLLLLVNSALLAWFLLRSPESPPPRTAPAPAAAAPVPAAQTAPVAPSAPAFAPPLPAAVAPAPAAAVHNAAATHAARAPAPPAAATETPAELPDYSRVSAEVPPLRLDLHAYSPEPLQRYALINMHKVHEGDTLPEGPRVLKILKDGVVLSYQGNEFVLGRN